MVMKSKLIITKVSLKVQINRLITYLRNPFSHRKMSHISQNIKVNIRYIIGT